jgi:hypothetical protein
MCNSMDIPESNSFALRLSKYTRTLSTSASVQLDSSTGLHSVRFSECLNLLRMTIRTGTLGRSAWKSLKLDFNTLVASIEKHSKKVDREAQVEHMSETSRFRDGIKPIS